MNYRSEIDGLRALAVLPVLFFHADFKFFSGGFLGVDVFFVISGYLITNIICEELAQQKFSLINFYERRARRIMPALLFMGLGTFAMAYTVMPSNTFKEFGLSLVNVYTFTSNIYFYFTSGYFSTIADEKPLLHTWSLAVEEQFYLIFPVLLMLLFRKVRKYILTVILVLLISSLLSSHYMTHSGHKDAGFYLISSRAWELLAGAILVFVNFSRFFKSSVIKELFSLVGLSMLLCSFIVFDKKDALPGFYSLIPVIGTMLLIVFTSSSSIVGKLLSHHWLVFIGLISYSLYLWHQPILALIKLKTVGAPNFYFLFSGLLVSFLLAILSWKYIESPFRDKRKTSRKFVFCFTVLGISISVILGLFIFYKEGLPNRFSSRINYSEIKYSPKREECHTSGTDYLKPNEACRYFEGNDMTWAVLGDSHGVELSYSLAEILNRNQESVLHLTNSACPAAAFMELILPKGCANWSREAIDVIVGDIRIKNVILIYRYSYHFFGDHIDSYPNLPNRSPINHVSLKQRKAFGSNVRDYYWSSFKKTVDTLIDHNKRVFVVYPIPELPLNITKMIAPLTIFSDMPTIRPEKALPIDYYYRRNRYVINKLDSLSYGTNLIPIKVDELFCGESHCIAAEYEKSFYADDDHLSLYGARKLAIEILSKADKVQTLE